MIQETSRIAYDTIKKNGMLKGRQLQVYEEIFKFQPISINRLIQNLGRPGMNTGSITGRISELQRMGVIWEVGQEQAHTGHRVILWGTTEQLPRKPEKVETWRQRCIRQEEDLQIMAFQRDELATLVKQLKDEVDRLRKPPMYQLNTATGQLELLEKQP